VSILSSLEQYINEIESWIEQVKDDDLGVGDYDFIDNIVHKGMDGNNGLAQVGAYLAIYENEEGELEVDEELVETLDERQSELPQGGANRFSNIVYEGRTSKRQNNTLLDNEVDGHQRLYEMLDEARNEFEDINKMDIPEVKSLENRMVYKSSVTNQSPQGDNHDMTFDEQDIEEAAGILDGVRERNQDITGEVVDAVDTLVRYAGHAQKAETQRDELAEDYIETMRSFQSYLDQQYNSLDEASANVQYVAQVLQDIDLWDRQPDTDDMQDGMRNPNF
jgi:hypothetical protein